MVLRKTKQYLPMFQPSKQATSGLVRTRIPLIFPSSLRAQISSSSPHLGIDVHKHALPPARGFNPNSRLS